MVSVLAGVTTSVISKLTALLGEEYAKLKGVHREVEFMKDELSSMNALLQRLADVECDLDVQTKEWSSQVREMSYDIEDCIDDFMKSLGQTEMAKSLGLVQSVVQQLKALRVRHQISSQIKGLKARVEDASKRRMRYKLDERTFEPSILRAIDPRLPSFYAEQDGLVGIDQPRDELIKCLMEGVGSSVQKLKVISIAGPGGLGKTTLANEVYRKLEGQFQCRAFVSLSQKPDVSKILRNIFSQVCQQELPSTDIWDEGKLIDAIREVLKNKRYLVIIDDVWSTQAWKIIKCSLFLNDLGSRIMTTTRSIDIAKSCCSPQQGCVYEIKPLTTANSKSLFAKRIFGSGDICPQLEEVSSEILKKCAGSPLAILTIASLLANKDVTNEEWERVYKSIGSTMERDPGVEEMRRILSLSYDDLPYHLKTCLLYLSIFPEDYEIERDRLIRRWIAEGFICTDGGQDLEEIGACYFNDLINRSMLQPVKIQYDGRVDSCRVHDMILDLLKSKSIEANFATFFGDQNQKLVLQHKIRRLSLNCYSQEHIMFPSSAIISHCRSLSIVGYAEKMHSLSKFRVLRVLDIENGEDMESNCFEHLWKLFHLQYLRLNVRSISALPEQLGELQRLKTLDMGWTKIRKIPKSIVQLEHLTCLRVRNLELPEGIGNLHALQELSDIKVNRDSLASSLLELGSLSKLRILGLCWCLVDVDSNKETLADNLVSSLRRLGRLNLRSLNIQNNYRYSRIDFLLDSWFPSPHLLQMFQMGMFYFFPRVPAWVASLDNLTYLDININPVQEEALEILGGLPALLVVWLTSRSAAPEQRLVVSSNMFISLKEFYFTCWSNGAGLMFEAGAMPRLEKLRVPFDAGSGLNFGIQHLSSLRNLSVEIICMGATVREVEALEEAIRNTADLLPNCPTLEIRTWDDEHLMKEEQGKAEEEIQTSG